MDNTISVEQAGKNGVQKGHEMTSELTEHGVILTRVIDAPRELVFRAWTDPAMISNWWGPHAFRATATSEPRMGGRFTITMHGEDGAEYPMNGVYTEFVAPERISCTCDLTGHPKEWFELLRSSLPPSDYEDVARTEMTVTFEPVGQTTRIRIESRFRTSAIRDAYLKTGMNEGWSQSLERLEQLTA